MGGGEVGAREGEPGTGMGGGTRGGEGRPWGNGREERAFGGRARWRQEGGFGDTVVEVGPMGVGGGFLLGWECHSRPHAGVCWGY
jgi:hypothetical protein